MRNKFKIIIRHIYSILAFCMYIFFYLFNLHSLVKFYRLKNRKIHIICPGPTSIKFLDADIEKDDIIIFINHGVS